MKAYRFVLDGRDPTPAENPGVLPPHPPAYGHAVAMESLLTVSGITVTVEEQLIDYITTPACQGGITGDAPRIAILPR